MPWLIIVLAIAFILVPVSIILTHEWKEAKKWNKGKCAKCGKAWQLRKCGDDGIIGEATYKCECDTIHFVGGNPWIDFNKEYQGQ